MLYEYVGAMLAVRRTRDLARSALPGALVEADRTRGATDLLDHLRQVQRKEQEFTRPTSGPAGLTATPAGCCGRRASGSCSPSSPWPGADQVAR
jgi:hypothetical protein